MTKTQQAILNGTQLGGSVVPSKSKIHVHGKRAVEAAKELQAKGQVTFVNTSEYGRIGRKLDGSWKYGFVFQGFVVAA